MKKSFPALTLLVSGALLFAHCKKSNQAITPSANVSQPASSASPSVAAAASAVLWNGDASLGASNVWKVLNFEGDGTITVENDATYGPVWKFYKPSGSHRTEGHGAKGFEAAEGDDIYIGWRSKLEMPANLSTNAVFQWKAYGDSMLQNYPIVISTTSGGSLHLMHFAPGKIGTELWHTTLQTDTWHAFVLHLKVSKDGNTGFIEFWYNGVQQSLSNGSTRYYCRTLDADHCDPKWGVYGGDGGEVTNYVHALRIGSSYAAAAPSVTLYQNCSYGGWSAHLPIGAYTLSQLEALGVVNDDASSIRVPDGVKVILYQNNNFGGSSLTLTADDNCFIGDGFNDKLSSMIVTTD